MRVALLLVASAIFVTTPKEKRIVAALESSSHPIHAKNIANIIGEKHTKLYLTDISSDKQYDMTLQRIRDGQESIVNLSLQSCYPTIQEELIIKQMVRKKKIVIVASGNKDSQFKDCKAIYPANYNIKGMIVVGTPNSHTKNVDITIPDLPHCYPKGKCLRGSSQATARVSRMALEMLKDGLTYEQIINKLDKR